MIEATCPVLPISSRVLLPASVLRLTLGKQASLAMAEHLLEEKHEALPQQRGSDALSSPYSPFEPLNQGLFSLKRQMLIGIFTYVGKEEEEQVNNGTFLDSIGKSRIGTLARIVSIKKKPSGGGGSISITVQGLHRFRVTSTVQRKPFYSARLDILEDDPKIELSYEEKGMWTDLLQLMKTMITSSAKSRFQRALQPSKGLSRDFFRNIRRLAPGSLYPGQSEPALSHRSTR